MDRKRILGSFIRKNRGQSVIEFALILPLLLVILFGITEFGRAWMTLNLLTSAAREGARLAVVTAPDWNAVTQRVTDVCNSAGVTPTITYAGPDEQRRVTVTVKADFEIIPGDILGILGGGGLSGTIPLRATTVMRHESL